MLNLFSEKTPAVCLFALLLMLSVHPSTVTADDSGIGKIVKQTGHVKKTNINCDSDSCGKSGLYIYPGDRITTGKKSSAEIVLNDGTAVRILEKSEINIFSVLNERNKTVTDLFSDYGKFKIIQHNDFIEYSLLFKTRTAIIKTVCASVNIATGYNETGIFVYKGEAGFANIDPFIINAYVVKTGEESFLKKSSPPLKPEKIKIPLRSSWLNRHFLSADNTRIVKYKKTSGVADWFLVDKN